jgi:hypothetical protein
LFYNRYNSLPSVDELNTIVASSIGNLDEDDRGELLDTTKIITTISKWTVRDDVIRDIAGKYLRDVRINKALLTVAENRDDLPAVIQSLTSAARFELSTQEMSSFKDLSRLDNAHDIIRKIPLGWDSFDDMTQGGILRPSLMLVVGKPYSGKTQVLLNLADNLAAGGYKILYFSMELSNKLLMMRADAAKLGMHYQELYLPENIDKTRELLADKISTMTGDVTIIKYPPGTSLNKIKIHCDIYATVYGAFDVLMIDYVGLVVPSNKKDNMHESGKAVAEELITIGEQHDAAVIAAAQTTKGATSVAVQDLTEEHIGGSWGLQQVAYDVIMLSKSQKSLLSNKLMCKWVKNRSGGKLGINSLYEIPNTFKLTDDVNEMFELSKQAGIQLLPEEVNAVMESINAERE